MIKEAMEKGKQDPIRTTIDDERKAQRELLINDGDMSFISSDDEDFRWIDDFANGRIPIGLDTGDAHLDGHFRYKKEFVIVNGHSNVGKTTMVLYLMVNAAIRHGWKWRGRPKGADCGLPGALQRRREYQTAPLIQLL